MTCEQQSWRFHHLGAWTSSEYEVRQQAKKFFSKHNIDIDMNNVAVGTSRATVSWIGMTPAASQQMRDHMPYVMGAMAEIAGYEMAVDIKSTTIGVLAPSDRTIYIIPSLIVVDKKSKNWGPWREEKLTSESKEELRQIIVTGIQKSLQGWNDNWSASDLVLIDEGRPMVISPCVGPHGVARLNVKFIAPWRLEGHAFCGLMNYLDHGRIVRGGVLPATKKPTIEMADEFNESLYS